VSAALMAQQARQAENIFFSFILILCYDL